MKAIFNWSGGKDSSMALYKVLKEGKYEVRALLTTVSEQYKRVSMHGVREELLDLQAESIGIPLNKVVLPSSSSMEEYDRIMEKAMAGYRQEGISHSIFGDIFLEDLRTYRENQLKKAGMKAVFPLWGRSTKELMEEFINAGFKAIVVCVNAKYLDRSFAGRSINREFIKDLPAEVDPCGENGEYHTFVYDGPIFKKPILFKTGEVVYREFTSNGEEVPYDTGFYYQDLLLQ